MHEKEIQNFFKTHFLQPLHEFNSSVEDDQSAVVEESRTASADIEEDEEVSGEEDLMYRDEVFEEDSAEDGDETEDEKGNLSAEEAFNVEEQQQGREVMLEAEDEKVASHHAFSQKLVKLPQNYSILQNCVFSPFF